MHERKPDPLTFLFLGEEEFIATLTNYLRRKKIMLNFQKVSDM
jgi:hypothetical protein